MFKKQGRLKKAMIYWDQICVFLVIKFLLRQEREATIYKRTRDREEKKFYKGHVRD